MNLQTLGNLTLEGTSFTQPKPLLLLAYLALEGPQQRKHVAELFWQTGNGMKSLSMTLTRLRQGAGEVVASDTKRVWTTLTTDAKVLLESLDKSDWQKASELYRGAFLEGVVLEDWSNELEEWVYTTREYLAERTQYALLNLAEEAAKKEDFNVATKLAERAYKLPGLAGNDVTALKRLYTLLCAGNSLLALEVRKEAESYGASLALTTQEAKATFESAKTKSTQTLPMRGTSFVGRDLELTELASSFARPTCQLLTLLGSAGLGKTRLALQFAHEQQKLGAYSGGVYFVALESLTESASLGTHLAQQLGIALEPNREPLEQLSNYLENKQTLLALDNFEHLVDAAPLLSKLVQGCPQLRVLVTSRERLNIEEEHLFSLEGLRFPLVDSSSQEASTFDAVQLFQQRAKQLHPEFNLDNDLAQVLKICQLVEGLPLGIELAAGWVRLLPCAEIAAEIQRNLDFLASTSRNTPDRHRSLRAAFDYSWKLLSPREQEVLAKLSVFRGGFRREAASEVTGATIPLLASLVDKSLLRVLTNGRYDQHPLVYQYSREKLLGPTLQACERGHASYYLHLLKQQEEAIRQGRQREALQVFGEEWQNIRVLLERTLAEKNLPAFLDWLELFELVHDLRGSYQEALEFLSRGEALLKPEDTVASGRILVERAWFELRLGQYDRARVHSSTALGLLQKKDFWRASALNIAGILARRLGDYSRAHTTFEEGLTIAKGCQNENLVAKMLASLADVEEVLGQHTLSEEHFLEAVALYRKHGHLVGLVRNLNNLGWLYYVQGRFDKARTLYEEGLQLARTIEFQQTIPYLLNNLGYIALEEEHYSEALTLNLEALRLAKSNGESALEAEVLTSLARCKMALGDDEAAWLYTDKALELSWAMSFITLVLQALLAKAKLFLKQAKLGQAARLCYVVSCHEASTSLEKTLAAEVLSSTHLAAPLKSEALTYAQRTSLEKVVWEHLHPAYRDQEHTPTSARG